MEIVILFGVIMLFFIKHPFWAFFILFVIISLYAANKANKKKKINEAFDTYENLSIPHREAESYRYETKPGSFVIVEDNGRSRVTAEYEGGERYVDGHCVRNADDMTKWYVFKGFSEGIGRRIDLITKLLNKPDTENGDALYEEWKLRYDTYRKCCIDHGLWNSFLNDHTNFVPTQSQLSAENSYKCTMETLYKQWQTRHEEYTQVSKMILDYLRCKPYMHAEKSKMMDELCRTNQVTKKQIAKIYRLLIKNGTIGEKTNKSNILETRIIRRRGGALRTENQLITKAIYYPDRFRDVTLRDIYKAEYTVGPPENLDRDNNCCVFTSLSDGSKYFTSLEKCTCPVYQGTCCKHMLALAMYLGYYRKQ